MKKKNIKKQKSYKMHCHHIKYSKYKHLRVNKVLKNKYLPDTVILKHFYSWEGEIKWLLMKFVERGLTPDKTLGFRI